MHQLNYHIPAVWRLAVAAILSSTACRFDPSIVVIDETPPSCTDQSSECQEVPDASTVSADWYEPLWTYRRLLSIPANLVVENLVAFPVLVYLRGSELTGKTQPSGGDIVFVSLDGQTILAHEIELYDEVNGDLFAWVNIPLLSSSEDNQFYIYYGNSASDDQQQPDDVWDNAYQGVWHLAEQAADESQAQQHQDSSGRQNHGEQSGNEQVPGQIAQAQYFDGTDDQINIANPTSFALGDADCTITAWIRTDASQERGIVVKSSPTGHEPQDRLFGINHTRDSLGIDHGWIGYLGGSSTINDDQWHHVAWVQRANSAGDAERWQLWVDGNLEGEETEVTDSDPNDHTLRIGGGSPTSFFPRTFRGAIDEVRISHTDRSAGWLQTSYDNQRAPRMFHAVGVEQTLTSRE